MRTIWMQGLHWWKTRLSNLRRRTDHQIKVMGKRVCQQVFYISKTTSGCDLQASVKIKGNWRSGFVSTYTKAIYPTQPSWSLVLPLVFCNTQLWVGGLMWMRKKGESMTNRNSSLLFTGSHYILPNLYWFATIPKNQSFFFHQCAIECSGIEGTWTLFCFLLHGKVT